MRLFPLCVWLAHVASIAGAPWGNYDGNGGLTDGHYCADNALSPPTTYDFSRGYWFGLTWASTAPSAGVFNFSGLDAALARADATNQYVEANALVGQCSPAWLYSKAVGVEPLIVSWKPPPTCVPPLCVPAGTWNCSSNNGQGCGCDGRYATQSPHATTFVGQNSSMLLDIVRALSATRDIEQQHLARCNIDESATLFFLDNSAPFPSPPLSPSLALSRPLSPSLPCPPLPSLPQVPLQPNISRLSLPDLPDAPEGVGAGVARPRAGPSAQPL